MLGSKFNGEQLFPVDLGLHLSRNVSIDTSIDTGFSRSLEN